jgi:ABC-type lipoprotein release transport system permease subunit
MTYRTLVVRRWSRRDRLGVLVIALTIAFLTGSVVVLLAAGTQATAIAAQFDTGGTVTSYDDGTAGGQAPDGAVVVPMTIVETPNGSATVVGVPQNEFLDAIDGRAFRAATGTTRGTIATPRRVRLVGPDAATTVTVRPRSAGASVFAPSWYVTNATTVRRLGPTGALAIEIGNAAGSSGATGAAGDTASLVGALAFFVTGLRETVEAFAAVTGGAVLLIGVTVYSVCRMSVRDRQGTIRVVRATGGAPRTVLGLFAARALLLTGVGVALGYAIGTIAVNAAVNAAVTVGVPTTLSTPVSGRAVRILLPVYAGTLLVGGLAGGLAAWPAVRISPGRLTDPVAGRAGDGLAPAWARPTLLGWRALLPTTATLTAFVAVAVVVVGAAGAITPVVATDGATITEPGSTHPVASEVPVAYADALAARDIDASPEILLFERLGRHAVPARGVRFGAFASVTDARLLAGRAPRGPGEAAIGRDLAATLDLDRGDRVTLGGSTRASVTRVRIVGTFAAPGVYDDQLLVPLSTARHLAGVRPTSVQFIRAERLPAGAGTASNDTVGVVGVAVPDDAVANGSVSARIRVRNAGFDHRTVTVPVRFRGRTERVTLGVPPTTTRTGSVTFPAGPPGTARIRAGDATATVRVRPADALVLRGLPERAPPGSEPLVRVTNATGRPVANATVRVGSTARRTDADGRVRVPLADGDTTRIRVTAGERAATTTVRVTEHAPFAPRTGLSVTPSEADVTSRPGVVATLSNPWNRTLSGSVRLVGPGLDRRASYRLAPGERRRISATLPRRPAGSYTVRLERPGTPALTATYRVTGDDRVAAALASSGHAATSGIGGAVSSAFGNLRVIVAVLLGLAALMTVGATSAVFARAVHARRRTLGIHRTTGAPPRAVVRIILGDAARVGVVAALLALVVGQAGTALLARAGYLTVFGVRLPPTLDPAAAFATAAAGVAIAVVSAGVVTGGVLATPPAHLLDGTTGTGETVSRPDRTGPGGESTDD